MADYEFDNDAMLDILGDYGVQAAPEFTIDSLNAWAVDLGGNGGHRFTIDALNEIVPLVGGSGTYRFNIDALNEISRALGGSSNYRFNVDALNAIAELPVAGGGEGAPEWVPDGAKIHIDLVRAFNDQDAAWVDGVGVVAVDTLLGTDANTDTGWGTPSEYDPDNLGASGYIAPNALAFIGALRTAGLSVGGATFVIDLTSDVTSFDLVGMSADGSKSVEFRAIAGTHVARVSPRSSADSPNTTAVYATGGDNKIALTITRTTCEIAVNGSDAVSAELVVDSDIPAGGYDTLFIDVFNKRISSITQYDPVSGAALTALSVVS